MDGHSIFGRWPPGGHFLGGGRGEEREKVDEILVYEEFYGWNL